MGTIATLQVRAIELAANFIVSPVALLQPQAVNHCHGKSHNSLVVQKNNFSKMAVIFPQISRVNIQKHPERQTLAADFGSPTMSSS